MNVAESFVGLVLYCDPVCWAGVVYLDDLESYDSILVLLSMMLAVGLYGPDSDFDFGLVFGLCLTLILIDLLFPVIQRELWLPI